MATYPKILSLCTGYAGLDLGIRLAEPGARTVCMVERELFAVANLVAKIEAGCLDDCPIWSNLETFDGQPWRGKVDIITAGIPCQPWSVAGKQQGIEDERWIWDDIYRIVREARPEWFFVEEVRGFIRGGLGLVIRDLADIGYVGSYDIFRASDVGAPHKRERIFMLARLADTSDGLFSRSRGRPETGDGAVAYGPMADTSVTRSSSSGVRAQPESTVIEPSNHDGKSQTMADPESRGMEGNRPEREQEPGTPPETALSGRDSRRAFWPTGPGQQQHEWEPPRVVADTPNGVYPGQTQSPLGRDADGCAAPLGRCICVPKNRVDELRLLGNGVLPLDAAIAWVTLRNRLKGAMTYE